MDCIFCRISKKEIPAEMIFEDNELVVFRDINPKADVHLLIVPKKHILSVNELEAEDEKLISKMIMTAKAMAKQEEVNESGYRLQFNVGRGGGQVVDHIHLHLIANK